MCSGPKRLQRRREVCTGSPRMAGGTCSLSSWQQLPRFSPDELNLLQDLLLYAPTPHQQPGSLACT